MKRCGAWVAGLVACATLGACGSPPVTRFHSLLPPAVPMAGGPRVEADAPAGFIATLALPAALAQPQLLWRDADGTLRLLEHERWIAPLDQELRVLLLQRLSQAGGAGPAPGAQLALEVLRWEATAAGVRLEAHWQWRRDGAAPWRCRFTADRPSGTDPRGVVAAHGATAALLADAVAASLGGRCRADA